MDTRSHLHLRRYAVLLLNFLNRGWQDFLKNYQPNRIPSNGFGQIELVSNMAQVSKSISKSISLRRRNRYPVKKIKPKHKNCNICGVRFTEDTKFDRFCESCRTTSELYHYSEWLAVVWAIERFWEISIGGSFFEFQTSFSTWSKDWNVCDTKTAYAHWEPE